MKLEVGKLYLRRDGGITGPLGARDYPKFKFSDPHTGATYTDDGNYWSSGFPCAADLIGEVNREKLEKDFNAWVVFGVDLAQSSMTKEVKPAKAADGPNLPRFYLKKNDSMGWINIFDRQRKNKHGNDTNLVTFWYETSPKAAMAAAKEYLAWLEAGCPKPETKSDAQRYSGQKAAAIAFQYKDWRYPLSAYAERTTYTGSLKDNLAQARAACEAFAALRDRRKAKVCRRKVYVKGCTFGRRVCTAGRRSTDGTPYGWLPNVERKIVSTYWTNLGVPVRFGTLWEALRDRTQGNGTLSANTTFRIDTYNDGSVVETKENV